MKKIILLLAILLLLSSKVWASIAYVNGTDNYTGSVVSTLQSGTVATTTGNFIVVTVTWYTNQSPNNQTVSSVMDTAGNTYIQCPSCFANQSYSAEDIWYAYNITGNASNNVTVNMSGNVQYISVGQDQFSGVATTSPYQTSTNGFQGSGTSITSSSFSPSIANGLNFASFNISDGPTPTAGGSYSFNNAQIGEYLTGAPSGAQTASVSWSGTEDASMGVISFAPAPSYPTVTTQAPTSITTTSIVANGNITAIGGSTPTVEGFVGGTSSVPTNPGNVAPGSSGYAAYAETSGSFSTGTFTQSLTGLSPCTEYYGRAFAGNTQGYAYGSEVSFITGQCVNNYKVNWYNANQY